MAKLELKLSSKFCFALATQRLLVTSLGCSGNALDQRESHK